jgi:hypothetical protein
MGITEKILYFFGYVKIPEQAIRITENIKYLLDRLEQVGEKDAISINAIKHGMTALDNFLREGARAGAPNRKAGE